MAGIKIEASIEAGKKLLLAYVNQKLGKDKTAAKLFAEAATDPAIDSFMEGLADSIQRLEAGDEESMDDPDMDLESEDPEDDPTTDIEDDDADFPTDDEDAEAEATAGPAEIPVTVASVLDLKY